MSEVSTPAPKRRRLRSVHDALQAGLEQIKHDFATMSKEQFAERLTAFEPGVPHYWLGRLVEPITKEEFLAYWNGGPEPPLRYKDAPGTSATSP